MKLNIEPLRSWFGFTRRERRSSFILLLIIILIFTIRFTIPPKSIIIEDFTDSISAITKRSDFYIAGSTVPDSLFSFNPNTVPFETLIKLGFTAGEAKTLINYRAKGGRFRQPSDIKKIYGIEPDKAERYLPFIIIPADTTPRIHSGSYNASQVKTDINNCDTAMLDKLPGIGPVLSARIIKYRYLLGGFARIEQLREVYGLSSETYDLIKERITLNISDIKRIDINTSDYKNLFRLPYLEKYDISAIIKYRELKGRIGSLEELVNNKIITVEKADKAGPYMEF